MWKKVGDNDIDKCYINRDDDQRGPDNEAVDYESVDLMIRNIMKKMMVVVLYPHSF